MKRGVNIVPSFMRGQDGSVTIFGLLVIFAMLIIGGLALDVANAYRVRTHITVAADSAAHAALVVRETQSEGEAKQMALIVADSSLRPAHFGEAIRAEDITFGHWDKASLTFTPDSGSRAAVMVNAARLQQRNNAVGTYFLRFIGMDFLNVRRSSVFTTYRPTCFREGFVADGVVNTTTGNLYKSGFCIHSNTAVAFNTGNTFERGTIVSMPDKRNVILPSSGLDSNTGLQEALRDGSYHIRILQRIKSVIEGVRDPSSPHFRSWIASGASEINLSPRDKLDRSKFVRGRIHTIWCSSSGQAARLPAGTILNEVVIVTNCLLRFGENVGLEDVTIVSTNSAAKSFSGASGIRLGKNDNCAPGGGAQLVTMGGIEFPQYLKMFGSQMLAKGDVSFTSDANGFQGASIIAGGRIDGTTDSVMGFCDGEGMENNFEANYFRLAL